MSHWSTDLIIDNIRDILDTIRALEAEMESLYGAGLFGQAADVYAELEHEKRRLRELENHVGL